MGWRFDGMNPAKRAVLTANSAIAWSGPGGPRSLQWFGFAMCTARTWISSFWTTVRAGVSGALRARRLTDMAVHAVMTSKARHLRRSSAALSPRSLIRAPVLTAADQSPVSHLLTYQPAMRSAFSFVGTPSAVSSSQSSGSLAVDGLGEGVRPASAFLAFHRRPLVLGAEAGIETEHSQRAAALAECDAGMRRGPHVAGAAADVDKALRRLPTAVVQHRRVLHREHDGPAAAAPGHRVLMGLKDVLHADHRVGQDPVRGPLLRRTGKDYRQRRSRTHGPGPVHRDQTLALRPYSVSAHVASSPAARQLHPVCSGPTQLYAGSGPTP